jgi:hypothetical protein
MNPPLVTVICLCHNQAPYVAEALQSVWAQTYAPVQLLVVDDASTDGSQAVIRACLEGHPGVPFLALEENVGNCRAFNRALALAQGDWVVDLAADDVLLPHRLATQLSLATSLPADYGVIFSDAALIDADGRMLGTFYRRDSDGHLAQAVPQGRVWPQLLRRAFVCTPTMLMRRKMLEELGGYNEALSYEDYDLWVRSGKDWRYAFQDAVLTKKRLLTHSHGQRFYDTQRHAHLASTWEICHDVRPELSQAEEWEAWAQSVRYHLRQSVWLGAHTLALDFGRLLPSPSPFDRMLMGAAWLRLPLSGAYRLYRKWRFGR